MSQGESRGSTPRPGPISPVAHKAYGSDTPEWLSNNSSQETLTTSAREKSKFFTYNEDESRSSTPEALSLDLGTGARGPSHQKDGSGDSTGTAVNSTRNSSEDGLSEVDVVMGGVGRLPDEVYDRTLNWWRAAIRRRIMKNTEWESRVLATMQVRFI